MAINEKLQIAPRIEGLFNGNSAQFDADPEIKRGLIVAEKMRQDMQMLRRDFGLRPRRGRPPKIPPLV